MEKHLNNTSLFSKSAALTLVAVNVVLFFLTEALPSLRAYLSLNTVLIIRGRMYWQFISYMFVHASLMHLLGNMLGLVFFGTAVERSLGTKQFLILYFASGLASGMLSFAVYAAAGMSRVFYSEPQVPFMPYFWFSRYCFRAPSSIYGVFCRSPPRFWYRFLHSLKFSANFSAQIRELHIQLIYSDLPPHGSM